MVNELDEELVSILKSSHDFCEDAVEWFSKKGIQIWITPYSLSSSGGWSYNLRKWKEGQIIFESLDSALTTSMSRGDAYREAFKVALSKI